MTKLPVNQSPILDLDEIEDCRSSSNSDWDLIENETLYDYKIGNEFNLRTLDISNKKIELNLDPNLNPNTDLIRGERNPKNDCLDLVVTSSIWEYFVKFQYKPVIYLTVCVLLLFMLTYNIASLYKTLDKSVPKYHISHDDWLILERIKSFNQWKQDVYQNIDSHSKPLINFVQSIHQTAKSKWNELFVEGVCTNSTFIQRMFLIPKCGVKHLITRTIISNWLSFKELVTVNLRSATPSQTLKDMFYNGLQDFGQLANYPVRVLKVSWFGDESTKGLYHYLNDVLIKMSSWLTNSQESMLIRFKQFKDSIV
ncbi:hypothetical protein BC833DRAFT_565282 [Globomyces pollinis-pini]|nr:hypothetical protein BC833DRAFT_565282 [Globomyces pollinis-pini]